MNFGVTIDKGASPWQIFARRKDGTAGIRLEGRYFRVRLSQELPLQFTFVPDQKVIVKARVALESTGENIVPWTPCDVLDDEHWSVTFGRVPAGGLYRIETYMEYEGWDGLSCTRGDMVHFIGVGDVFVIAGQSNAAGRAKNPIADEPEPGVHVFRPSGAWEMAAHPLNETTGAKYIGHFENHNPGHSPWLHFAKRLKKELGCPIGLVPAAYGGAPLRWWNREENGALFNNMLDMLDGCGASPKAVLWYQGEAEGYENSAETYFDRFTAFVKDFRQALGNPELPFITVQLNRCLGESSELLDRQWGIVREAQRRAMHELSNVVTLPSSDTAMYDFIHNAAEGNLAIGERCARAALDILYRRPSDWKAPEPERVVKTADNAVLVRFSHIENWLNPFDVPAALLPFSAEDESGLSSPIQYVTGQDCMTITFDRSLKKGAVLHGMWRMNPGAATPSDCMRMPLLSFYGVPISEQPEV